MSLAETLRRAVAPRLVVATSCIEWPAQLSASLRRRLGQPAHIELFFAFDDPYAAIALPGLIKIAQQRRARLTLYPLIERGIANDPAAESRRRHAVEDSQRLARRFGKTLSRSTSLSAQDTAFLAAWTQTANADAGVINFAAAALEQLWFKSSGAVKQEDFRRLHSQYLHSASAAGNEAALASNTARLLKLGHWESPAALVEGQWFLAHERLAQINDHLERLGW
jgi:2-hydroxychromene-2-carboxylate isomerase